MSIKVKLWAGGLLLAIIGIVLARVISNRYAGETLVQLGVYFAGVTLALAGLVIIVAGIRKK